MLRLAEDDNEIISRGEGKKSPTEKSDHLLDKVNDIHSNATKSMVLARGRSTK